MQAHSSQRGAGTLMMVVVIFLVIMIALLAGVAFNRTSSSRDDAAQTMTLLRAAARALDAYAAGNARLPCPADPSLDTGVEVPTAPGAATCSFGQGTLPWATIGIRHDDAIDSWGRKISYRVYTGAAGSLTQPGGASMVDCDTVEPAPAGVAAGGLCRTTHDTTPPQYLAGKGLSVTDMGVNHPDAAFVLVSHGAKGLGGYTVAGTRLPMPTGTAETKNTNDTGPFTIQAFCDSYTMPAPACTQDFDDLLAYRTLSDLVKRAGLVARDWPEPPPPAQPPLSGSASTQLDRLANSPGDLGTDTITVPASSYNVSISGFSGAGATPTDLTYDVSGSSGTGGLGIAGGGNLLTDIGGEMIRVTFPFTAAKFGITLNNFGTYPDPGGTGTFTERAELRFYAGGSLVGSPLVLRGCHNDGDLAAFSDVNPPAAYDTVEIRALPATSASSSTSVTGFLVSALTACDAKTGSCVPDFSSGPSRCPYP